MTSIAGCKQKARALYVHVPYCRSKCRYCDFYSLPVAGEDCSRFLTAATTELAKRAGNLQTPLASVFLGGGTPTVLGPELLAATLSMLMPLAGSDTEFTVEANPESLTPEVAAVLTSGGVNRVSLGAQSFQAGELKLLGRPHGPRQITGAVEHLRKRGIENISLDLIYGIPAQTLESWRDSLRQALDLHPEHLSCYALSFDAGTPLAADLEAGRICEMDEEVQRDCYLDAIATLRQAGLEHYEISNFARPFRRCRHNMTYWRNEPYVGIGPGAASFLGSVRWMNRPDVVAYVHALEAGQEPPAEAESLTGRHAMAETLMLGLRLIEGVQRQAFRERFGQDPVEAFPHSFRRYRDLGMLEITEASVHLTEGALFLSNSVLADILAEA